MSNKKSMTILVGSSLASVTNDKSFKTMLYYTIDIYIFLLLLDITTNTKAYKPLIFLGF